MGDFNFKDINLVDWVAEGQEQIEFLDLINDCFLTQHVHLPTRGKNVLNLVLTSELTMVEGLKINNPVANSAHNLLTWNFNCEPEIIIRKETGYSYWKGNYEKIETLLTDINWGEEYRSRDVEGCSMVLKDKQRIEGISGSQNERFIEENFLSG